MQPTPPFDQSQCPSCDMNSPPHGAKATSNNGISGNELNADKIVTSGCVISGLVEDYGAGDGDDEGSSSGCEPPATRRKLARPFQQPSIGSSDGNACDRCAYIAPPPLSFVAGVSPSEPVPGDYPEGSSRAVDAEHEHTIFPPQRVSRRSSRRDTLVRLIKETDLALASLGPVPDSSLCIEPRARVESRPTNSSQLHQDLPELPWSQPVLPAAPCPQSRPRLPQVPPVFLQTTEEVLQQFDPQMQQRLLYLRQKHDLQRALKEMMYPRSQLSPQPLSHQADRGPVSQSLSAQQPLPTPQPALQALQHPVSAPQPLPVPQPLPLHMLIHMPQPPHEQQYREQQRVLEQEQTLQLFKQMTLVQDSQQREQPHSMEQQPPQQQTYSSSFLLFPPPLQPISCAPSSATPEDHLNAPRASGAADHAPVLSYPNPAAAPALAQPPARKKRAHVVRDQTFKDAVFFLGHVLKKSTTEIQHEMSVLLGERVSKATVSTILSSQWNTVIRRPVRSIVRPLGRAPSSYEDIDKWMRAYVQRNGKLGNLKAELEKMQSEAEMGNTSCPVKSVASLRNSLMRIGMYYGDGRQTSYRAFLPATLTQQHDFAVLVRDNYDFTKLIFIGEVGFDFTGTPCRTWRFRDSVKEAARQRQNHCVSLILAISICGIVGEGIVVKDVPAEAFCIFLDTQRKIFDKIVPGNVLVFDNSEIHTDKMTKDTLAANNMNYITLPADSIPLNPIWLFFGELKKALSRQNEDSAFENPHDVIQAVKSHVFDLGTNLDFQKLYWHALSFYRRAERGFPLVFESVALDAAVERLQGQQ